MLHRKFRLNKKTDFQRVLKNGKKIFGKYCVLLILPDPDLADSRVGIIVSNKISKKAVERNRAKRMIRDAVRRLLEQINGKFLLVFLAKQTILLSSSQEIRNEVKYLLVKGEVVVGA